MIDLTVLEGALILSSNFLTRYWYLALLFIGGSLALATWGNYQFSNGNTGGKEFLIYWAGTRALLIDGKSPYSEEVAEAIQTLAYGRPARAGEYEYRASFPLYTTFFFLPLSLIEDYAIARAIWMTILEVGILLLTWLTLVLTRWRINSWILSLIFVFALCWYYGIRPIVDGNMAILIAVTITGALVALRSGRDELAGILLGISTAKPALFVISMIFILLWTASYRKWRAIHWFAITVGLLSVVAALFVPDWPIQNLREILLFSTDTRLGTPGSVLAAWFTAAGSRLGLVLSGILGVILMFEWLIALRKEFRWFTWTVCLTLAASQWIGIQTEPGNFIILLTPLILVFSVLEERWGRSGQILVGLSLILFFAGPLALLWDTYADQTLWHPIMFISLPLFLFFGLYWTRWWAIHSPRLLIQDLHAFEDRS